MSPGGGVQTSSRKVARGGEAKSEPAFCGEEPWGDESPWEQRAWCNVNHSAQEVRLRVGRRPWKEGISAFAGESMGAQRSFRLASSDECWVA